MIFVWISNCIFNSVCWHTVCDCKTVLSSWDNIFLRNLDMSSCAISYIETADWDDKQGQVLHAYVLHLLKMILAGVSIQRGGSSGCRCSQSKYAGWFHNKCSIGILNVKTFIRCKSSTGYLMCKTTCVPICWPLTQKTYRKHRCIALCAAQNLGNALDSRNDTNCFCCPPDWISKIIIKNIHAILQNQLYLSA